MKFPTHLTLPEAERPIRQQRSKLLKSLDCSVQYPDKVDGTCKYARFGPSYHSFTFHYGIPSRPLTHLYWTQPLGNDAEAITTKCRELADSAFWQAAEGERRNYFARATLPVGRAVNPNTYRMDIRRARALGGKYALCVKVGNTLLPYSAIFDTLKEACQAWRDGDRHLVVGCCSRLDRNWQLPRLNPCVAQGHPQREGNEAQNTAGVVV